MEARRVFSLHQEAGGNGRDLIFSKSTQGDKARGREEVHGEAALDMHWDNKFISDKMEEGGEMR